MSWTSTPSREQLKGGPKKNQLFYVRMPKPDKKGWTNAGGASNKGYSGRSQMYDSLDAYDYDYDDEGYGGRAFNSKKSKKQKKAEKSIEEYEAEIEAEDEEKPVEAAESEGPVAAPEISGPSIQISLAPFSQEQETRQEQEVFQEDEQFRDNIVLETFDNWEDAMDALDTAVSKQEEERQAARDKNAPGQLKGK